MNTLGTHYRRPASELDKDRLLPLLDSCAIGSRASLQVAGPCDRGPATLAWRPYARLNAGTGPRNLYADMWAFVSLVGTIVDSFRPEGQLMYVVSTFVNDAVWV